MFVFFYMGIESLLILNRDLKTKTESYALDGADAKLEDPRSKIYCGNTANLLYFVGIYACRRSMHHEYDCERRSLGIAFKTIRTGMDWLFQGNMDWITLMAIFLFFFLAWDLCDRNRISGSYCIQNGVDQFQIAGIVSFILFFAINAIVEYIYDLFAKYGLMGIHSGLYIGIGECAFYIVACIILFVISSVLAERN